MPLGSTDLQYRIVSRQRRQTGPLCRLSAQLMARSGGYATLRMPSGEVRMINEDCRATFGAVSNPEHNLRSRRKSRTYALERDTSYCPRYSDEPCRPPHGGGEGKHKGNIPQTPWALYTRGLRHKIATRNPISLSLKIEGRSRYGKIAKKRAFC